MTVSTSGGDRGPTDAPRRWWVLGAALGALLVVLPLLMSRTAVVAEQGGASSTPGPVKRISRRRRWALGGVLGALVVAVTLAAAAPSIPPDRVVAVPTPGAPSTAVPRVREVASTGTSGGVAPVSSPVAAPADAPSVVVATTGTSVGVAPADPTELPAADETPTEASAPDPSPLPRSEPMRVRIPAIDLDSDLVALGLEPDGRMEVPPGAFPAGWYTGAPTPGEVGPAVLAGHVDYGGRAGVFSRLDELEPGDMVEVVREDDSTAAFRVTRVEQHDKGAFPTEAVYGDIDHAGLRLITCGGPFDRRANSYEDNVVVYAELDLG